MYEAARLLFARALTPLHVGIGRAESYYVDLPIQRDEFSYPAIWASSLKGAIKAYLSNQVKKYLGSEPEERESRPSSISILDTRLVFIPARTISGVWTYITTSHLLGYLKRYLDVYGEIEKNKQLTLNLDNVKKNVSDEKSAVSTKFLGKILLNEIELDVKKEDKLLEDTKLAEILPEDIINIIRNQGIVVVSDVNNIGLNIVNKSIVIQYRVKLKREEKVVETGALWSEEYLPIETIFVSLILCSKYIERQSGISKDSSKVCEEFENEINKKVIYVGGKETIGRGLLKLYTR